MTLVFHFCFIAHVSVSHPLSLLPYKRLRGKKARSCVTGCFFVFFCFRGCCVFFSRMLLEECIFFRSHLCSSRGGLTRLCVHQLAGATTLAAALGLATLYGVRHEQRAAELGRLIAAVTTAAHVRDGHCHQRYGVVRKWLGGVQLRRLNTSRRGFTLRADT